MLTLLYALRESKQQGQDCQDLLRALEQRLRRFRGMMRKMDPEQLTDEDAIFNAALYAIFNAIEDFRGRTEGEAVSFCQTVVRHRTISHMRAVKRPAEEGTDSLEKIPEPGRNPEEVLLDEERRRLVHKALDCLRPEERELLERVELHGERIVDIAQSSGEAQNTLTKRKNRAMRKLARCLSRLGGLEAL
jgi:RNA polymerase sigma factor (sigma-70 family)